MGKGRGPRKRRDAVNEHADSEKEIERQTQEKAELVPPARRPPTAVGAETPPLPPKEPHRSHPPPSPTPQRRLGPRSRAGLSDAVAENPRAALPGRAQLRLHRLRSRCRRWACGRLV